MKLFAIGACLLSLSGFVCGQKMDPLGSGKVTTYKIEDLPNDLVAVQLQTSKDSIRSLFQMSYYSSPIAVPNQDQPTAFTAEMLLQLAEVVWITKNEALSGKDYFIGYVMDSNRFPLRGTTNFDVNSVRFRLTYVWRNSIIAMTPREDFSPTRIKEMAKRPIPPTGTVVDRTVTLSNLKQIGTGLIILLTDNDDVFPYVQSTPQLFKFLEPYTKNQELFKTKNPMGGEFRFNMSLAGVSATDIEKPAETPMFFESEAWPDGKRGVCFTDSHAKFVTKEEWDKMQPLLKLSLKRHGKPIAIGAPIPPPPPFAR